MKGGVGKTTIAVNLAWFFANKREERVLVVDLDPQFNSSQYLLGTDAYFQHINKGGRTIMDIFERYTPTVSSKKLSDEELHSSVITKIPRYWRKGALDIVPSKLELSWTLKNPSGKEQLLKRFLDSVSGDYDVILIDCPPTESMFTHAAYLASDFVLVPVRPEFLSAIGLPLLARSIDDFKEQYASDRIQIAGIVFNSASNYKGEHHRTKEFVNREAKKHGWYVFEVEIGYSDSYPKGARLQSPIWSTSYARRYVSDEFLGFADEFVRRIGL